MKAIIFFIFFIFLAVPPVFGQIKIGDNPQNIDASSVLELESSSKVLVITRVTTLEMEAITPQRGGLVYNTDTECVNYYDGTQWVNLCDAVNFTITNDPIINGRSTIEITESAAGYNLEVAKNSILGDNIIDGGIGPDDIQDNSITQDKLAAESVGSSELRQNAVGSVEIRDGSIAPEDMANTIADQVLTTDENGIVQWEDTNDLFDLTFDKLDNTLTISRSTTPGVSTISLEALVGSDDQQLDLTGNILSIENDPNTVDLSTYLQQLSINTAGDEISLTNGGTITLPNPTIDTDEQNLGTTSLANEILTITIENGDPTTADLTPFATDAVVTAGLALKENVANKSNDVTLGNSTDLYPTQNAVKTYVDNTVGGSAQTIVSADPNNSIAQSVNDGGAFYNDGDSDDQNELQDIVFDETTNILTISTPLTTGNEVDLSSLADAPELDDGFIFVGNAASEPTPVAVGGDVIMNNIGQFSIENNTIESNNIVNNTITLEDLNQNGAADGQVIKWDETLNAGLGAWTVANDIANGTGTNITDTDDDDGLSNFSTTAGYNIKVDDITIGIANDALQIKEDAIGLDLLNPMGATTNGQILKWNQDNAEWELGTDVGGTLPDGQVLVGNAANQATPQTLSGDVTINNAGIVTISADAVENSMLDPNVAGNGLIQNTTSGALDIIPGTSENQILKWNNTTSIWELATDVGGTLPDGQVLIGNATDEATPQTLFGDATIANTGELTISADAVENTMIAANVAGNGLAKNTTTGALDIIPGTADNQILKWNNTTSIWELATDVGGTLPDGQVLIGNTTGEATPQTLSGDATINNAGIVAISADAVENSMLDPNVAGNGLIQNATSGALDIIPGTTENQILKWNNTTSIWEIGTNDAKVTGTEGSIFFADTDESLTENNAQLYWDNIENVLGIGTNTPDNGTGINSIKLHVSGGRIRAEGILNSDGSPTTPAYRFNNDTDFNSGMYFPAQDQLGFSVGGLETLLLKESAGNGLEIIAEGSLELKEQLLDQNGSPGNEGQILTATTTGTEWKEPQIFAMGKANGANSVKINGIQSISGGSGINTVNFLSPRIDSDYIIQLTVVGNNRIYVTSQTVNSFTVEIRDALTNNLVVANWYFTLSDFN
ncbi:beta strand repeat-containing protein [Maribacter dokdonensis]|uniref:beta strand repeat-containing protein n=1 Tax=Maribacter dokdonensis TaxID=320912 RepID=UPI003298A875